MPEQGLKELGSNPCRNSAEDAALAILGRALTSWFFGAVQVLEFVEITVKL
jgi:hypothetical protein